MVLLNYDNTEANACTLVAQCPMLVVQVGGGEAVVRHLLNSKQAFGVERCYNISGLLCRQITEKQL